MSSRETHPAFVVSSVKAVDVADARFLNSDEIDEAKNELLALFDSIDVKLGSNVVESALLGTDESEEAGNESVCASDCDESLERDLRLILQEHYADIVKKWGNSEQWVLELRDGRRVVVPIQFSLPRCVATELLDKQNQLALFPLESSDASNLSSALFEQDEVLVEDWVSDTYSEEAVQPLDVEPIAFSLPVAMAEQSPVDVEGGLFGVSWVMPHTVLGLLGCWQGSLGRHRNGYIWSIIPHCLMWWLWRERNCRCFEDYESSIPDLKLLFFRSLRNWLFALQSQSFPSCIDFLDFCNFGL